MIEYHYELDFVLEEETKFTDWIARVIKHENWILGDVNFIFCSDTYLHGINRKYLNHDSFTDIITFDYVQGNVISGDVFISIERVRDNAQELNELVTKEVKRVMVHGILHLMGHKDKSEDERLKMRRLEEKAIHLFHVEQ